MRGRRLPYVVPALPSSQLCKPHYVCSNGACSLAISQLLYALLLVPFEEKAIESFEVVKGALLPSSASLVLHTIFSALPPLLLRNPVPSSRVMGVQVVEQAPVLLRNPLPPWGVQGYVAVQGVCGGTIFIFSVTPKGPQAPPIPSGLLTIFDPMQYAVQG